MYSFTVYQISNNTDNKKHVCFHYTTDGARMTSRNCRQIDQDETDISGSSAVLGVSYWCMEMSCQLCSIHFVENFCIQLTFIYCISASWLSQVRLDEGVSIFRSFTLPPLCRFFCLTEGLSAHWRPVGFRLIILKLCLRWGLIPRLSALVFAALRHIMHAILKVTDLIPLRGHCHDFV